MEIKDYYKILELPVNADEDLIKKHFRRLALRFHPDTNGGGQTAVAWYREIQEAYQVLSDPGLKANYHQQRWLLRSSGKPFANTMPNTPEFIAIRCHEFKVKVSEMDHFRLSHVALQKELLALLNDEFMNGLEEYPDSLQNEKILEDLLKCLEPLDFPFIEVFKSPLYRIAKGQPKQEEKITLWFNRRKRQAWWDKNQGWIIGLATITICLCMFWATN